MPKITLKEFFTVGTKTKIIECTTQEQSDAVRKAFNAFGKKWASGNSYLELDYWESNTTYMFYSNVCMRSDIKPDEGEYEVYGFDDIIELSSVAIEEPEPDTNQLRVLLRSDYMWHEAHWDDKSTLFSVNGQDIYPTGIVSIENDPRTKYVQCTQCNSFIRNTKKAIEAHAKLASSSKACLTCGCLSISSMTQINKSFTKNDDGTYTMNRKDVCSLTCSNSYKHPQIDKSSARESCRYKRCSVDTIGPIDSFFLKYPGAFDDMATVDAIDMNKWQIRYKHSDNSVEFKLKGRYNIYIRTTSLGIIDRFEVDYRNNCYTLAYSKKYDKIFVFKWSDYCELTMDNSDFSKQYYNELVKNIRNIYKGEN